MPQDWWERMAGELREDWWSRTVRDQQLPRSREIQEPWKPPAELRRREQHRQVKRERGIGRPQDITNPTRRRRGWRKPYILLPTGSNRPHHVPSQDQVLALLRASKPYDARCAAFVALAVWSDLPTQKRILALRTWELDNLRMPRQAWVPVVRLLAFRERRGVDGDLLFCTFRFGLGKPLHRRDFERYLDRFQYKKGVSARPFTYSGLRRSGALSKAPRITLQEHLATASRLPKPFLTTREREWMDRTFGTYAPMFRERALALTRKGWRGRSGPLGQSTRGAG